MRWRVKLNQLEAFRGVILSGTTKQAAALMNVSQPAISRLIQDLENQIGQPLFERSQGRLLPKKEAYLLYKEIETTIAHLDHLDGAIRNIGRLEREKLMVIAPPAIGYGLMPRVLSRFYKTNQNISISLRIAPRREARAWLDRQDFDLAITMLPLDHPKTHYVPLPHVGAVCVFHESHRFAGQEIVHANDLAGEEVISLLPDTLANAKLEKIFSDLNIIRNHIMDAQTGMAICLLAREGLGTGIVDPMTADQFGGMGLESRPFEPAVPYEYGMFFPLGRTNNDPVEQLAEMVRQEITRYTH